MNDKFINKLYKDMIEKEFIKIDNNPSDLSQKKKIVEEYLDKLDRVSHKVIDREQIDRLKKLYYDRYVIKEENVPEEYFKKQEQLYLDRGYGHYTLSDRERKTLIDTIILEQKKSLDNILDYFLSEDSKFYPDKLKYWAFQGLLSLGNYDKEKRKYQKRNIHTVNPFIDFNREALALTINAMNSFINDSHIDEEVIKTDSFNKLYTYYINYLDSINKIDNTSTDGIWIKYNQGDNYQELLKSLQGKGTGWCTAAEEACKMQIQNGDFYVYYTKDNDNKYTNPRIAIRMDGSYQIAEIRGVANNQNLEDEMLPILDEKLKEFPDRDKYLKKVSDMEMLTNIYNKHKENKELSKEELLFLYEVHSSIQGFGYEEDPRINEIIKKRNIKQDLSYALNCTEEEIGLTEEDFKKSQKSGKKLKYYEGDLDLSSLKSAKGLILPQIMNGVLDLSLLESAERLILPEIMNGYLSLTSLKSAGGLILPEIMNGFLFLGSLESAEGLTLPQTINGYLYLTLLKSAEGLILPQTINGDLYLNSLESAKGLILPRTINRNLVLISLSLSEFYKIDFPDSFNGRIFTSFGTFSLEGLKQYLEEHKNDNIGKHR